MGCNNTCSGDCHGTCSGDNNASPNASGRCNDVCTSCANCTGTCQGGCSGSGHSGGGGGCSGCSGSCNRTCEGQCVNDCSGGCRATCADDCVGTCKNTCKGTCKHTCTGSCTETCADDCVGTCKNTCDDTCIGSCSATCANDCTGACKYSCTGCAGTCNYTSTTAACGHMCAGECTDTCVGTCMADCADDCTGTCTGSCTGTCTGSCTGCTGTCVETCTGSNSLIATIGELEWIIPYVKNEIYRRSGFNEDGEYLHAPEYRNYSGPILDHPDDSLFIIDSNSEIIRVGHGIPVIDMLLKICDFADARLVREFDLIPGIYHKEKLYRLVEFLRSIDFNAPVSYCRGACTGLCDNNCTLTCSGSCIEGCSSCSEQCTGMCSTGCTGCSESCGVSCGENCGNNCSGKASGCTGCSSGCVGCTGCTNTCLGSCSTSCTTSCQGCTAGCYGSTGYNDTCGACSSNCVSVCGGHEDAQAISEPHYSITLYHDNMIYGNMSSLYSDTGAYVSGAESVLALPEYNICGEQFNFKIGIPIKEWVSDDGSVLRPNDSVVFTTESPQWVIYKSRILVEPMLYNRYEYSSSFPVIRQTINVTQDMPKTIEITNDTMIFISATDSDNNILDGAYTEKWAVIINSNYVALPYNGILHQGDTVHLRGDNVNYKIVIHRDDQHVKQLRIASDDFIIVPFCKCRELSLAFDETCNIKQSLGTEGVCNLEENEHVKFTYMERNIPMRKITKPLKITDQEDGAISIYVNEYKEICADGTYIGILYNGGIEVYTPYTTEYIYGDSDEMLNAFIYIGDSLHVKIPLVRSNTSYEEYVLTIPETVGGQEYDCVSNRADMPLEDDMSVIFEFNKSYIIYGRQNIALWLRKR